MPPTKQGKKKPWKKRWTKKTKAAQKDGQATKQPPSLNIKQEDGPDGMPSQQQQSPSHRQQLFRPYFASENMGLSNSAPVSGNAFSLPDKSYTAACSEMGYGITSTNLSRGNATDAHDLPAQALDVQSCAGSEHLFDRASTVPAGSMPLRHPRAEYRDAVVQQPLVQSHPGSEHLFEQSSSTLSSPFHHARVRTARQDINVRTPQVQSGPGSQPRHPQPTPSPMSTSNNQHQSAITHRSVPHIFAGVHPLSRRPDLNSGPAVEPDQLRAACNFRGEQPSTHPQSAFPYGTPPAANQGAMINRNGSPLPLIRGHSYDQSSIDLGQPYRPGYQGSRAGNGPLDPRVSGHQRWMASMTAAANAERRERMRARLARALNTMIHDFVEQHPDGVVDGQFQLCMVTPNERVQVVISHRYPGYPPI